MKIFSILFLILLLIIITNSINVNKTIILDNDEDNQINDKELEKEEVNINFIRKVKNEKGRYFYKTSKTNITLEKISVMKMNKIIQIRSRTICMAHRILLIPKSVIRKIINNDDVLYTKLDAENIRILTDLFTYMINRNIQMLEFTIGCKQLYHQNINCRLGLDKIYTIKGSNNINSYIKSNTKIKDDYITKLMYVIYGSRECKYIKSNVKELIKLLSEREIQSLKRIDINEYMKFNEGLIKLDSIEGCDTERCVNKINDVYGIIYYYQFKILTEMCKILREWIMKGIIEYRIIEDEIYDSKSQQILIQEKKYINILSSYINKYYSIEYRLKYGDMLYEYITDTITYI